MNTGTNKTLSESMDESLWSLPLICRELPAKFLVASQQIRVFGFSGLAQPDFQISRYPDFQMLVRNQTRIYSMYMHSHTYQK